MHELSVTKQILEIALGKAQEAGATEIKRINLVIGDMSSILDDSVQFYFDLLSRDSMAQGALLLFQRIPTKVRCRRCSNEFILDSTSWNCTKCGEWDSEVIEGNEFYLDSIEVE